jgi:hypothetical protein
VNWPYFFAALFAGAILIGGWILQNRTTPEEFELHRKRKAWGNLQPPKFRSVLDRDGNVIEPWDQPETIQQVGRRVAEREAQKRGADELDVGR